jgi:phosphodiesterase/alkaline phosphatase D-like protein
MRPRARLVRALGASAPERHGPITSANIAMDRTLIERMASLARAVVPWRSVAAVALLSTLLCVVLSGNAHATLTPDGLLAGESGEEGHFGQSVALSADGSTAVVGAPTADGEAGAVLVFTRTGSTWTQQAELAPKGGEESGNGEFGASVALSAEGNTAVIGAPGDNGGVGAAWVFTRSKAGAWTQQAGKLTPEAGEEIGEGHFGSSVALSAEAEGSTAVIGGPGDNGGVGAAWVFTRSEGAEVWSQQGSKLTPEIGEEVGSGQFGASVALSSEGNTVAVGAPADNTNVGAVWVLTRTGSTWAQQGTKLIAKTLEEIGSGAFGSSVALSSDGNTALIGGPSDGEPIRGAAWVFTRSEGVWAQQGAKLTAKAEEESEKGAFGSSVELSSDGNIALIGGPGDNEDAGAAWTFARSSEGVWAQEGVKLTAKTEEESEKGAFGSSVALSSDGYTALIGGPADGEPLPGAAWAFVNPPTVSSVSPDRGPEAGETTVTITGTNLSEAAAVEFGSINATSFEVISPTSITAIAPAGTSTVDVSVTTSGGVSPTGSADRFTYVPPPAVVTEAASSIAQTTATLNATVNPNGGEVTSCKFEYGTTEFYGSSLPCSTLPGSGAEPVAVSASLESLSANTTYYFRIVATNLGGTSTDILNAQAFKTLPNAPTVVTGEASSIAQTMATLNATVNPHGGEVTSCKVDYGTTETYEKSVPCSSLPGSGSSPVAVSASLENLSANRTYHFRIVATNPGGTGEGADQTFKTLPDAPTVVTEEATSITQTTATLNATVNPHGGEVTSCKVDYGTTETYGKSVPCSSLPGSGSSPVAVSAAVTGLSANTTYHFRVVATNSGGTTKGADQTFETLPAAPTIVTKAASSISQTTATLNATVNPSGGEVTSCEFDYGTSEAYGKSAPCSSLPGSGNSAVAVSASVKSLSANTTYHFRIVATNPGGTSDGSDQTFTTLPNPPTVVTSKATSVTQTAATVNAAVNPNGGAVSDCHFEYGTTESYGATVPCTPSPGSGNSAVVVSAAVTGLSANTTYHFRVVATNAGGTSKGSDETLKTLPNAPTVVTKAASLVTQTTATLNATVNPNGGEVTECKLEYGETTSYGKTASCAPLPGSGSSAVAVSAAVTGLAANTTYHFRVVAVNAGGTSDGSDLTFKTLPNQPTVEAKAASSITQTSAMLNASVNPNGGEVSECKLEYGTSSTPYTSSVSCSPSPGSGEIAKTVAGAAEPLKANTTYHFRIVATNAGGTSKGSDETFKTLPNPPTVVTKAASSITQTTATLNATVNPNGGEVSTCKFEYGTTESYESSLPCSSLPGSGTSPVAVSAALIGLSPNTTYHFRIVATNSGGTTDGADQAFKTLPNAPTVETKTATSITQTTATLNATVNPNGGSVSGCELEYGPTESYGSSSACSPSPGSGGSPVGVSAAITGLSANTTYHFRVVATNAGGTGTGGDETFKTLPNSPTVSNVKPNKGPETGGTTVTITGTNLGEATAVKFGSTAAASVTADTGTSITAVSPAGTGTVDVTVTTAGGTSHTSTGDQFNYVPPPAVTGVSPGAGPTAGGTSVTITGTDLSEAAAVKFGSSGATSFKVNSATSITATSPAGTGVVDVTVSTAGGDSATSSADKFSYVPPPTVTNVTPNAGPLAAGTSVTITGANFVAGATVKFGAASAAGVKVVSETSITAVAPAGTGTVDVTVSTPGGTSAASAADQFSYVPLPTVTKVSPNKGPTGGGTSVTITGANFTANATVDFGTTGATGITVSSATSITAIAPAGIGAVDVTVSTPGGASATGSADKFSYVPPPTVTSLSPDAGPLAAGTSVTITGVNLGEAAAVKFGATNAVSFKVSSETSITAVAPAGTGTVDVTVSTVGGTSATGAPDKFTYVPPPTVTGVNPNAGPLAGGSSVTITGTNFTSNTEVKFGSTSATGVEVTSPTALTVVSAAGTGTVNVTVITPGGTSAPSAADEFSYPGPPTVVLGQPSSIGQTSAMLNAEINPNGGEVTQCYFHYERVVPAPGEIPVITPCVGLPLSGKSPMKVSALAEGLSASTSYRFSIEVINSFGEDAFGEGSEPFKTLPGPSVLTGAASSVTQTSATLNATVNPNGGEVSDCHFEYGTTESYGKSVSCSSLPGSGTSPVAVSASLMDLSINTTYYFRIVATNPGGESKDTLGQKFTTLPNPPVVITAAAASPTQTSVTLNGTVNPNGGTVSDCHFEYGSSTSYGSSVSCLSLPGSGESPVPVSAALEGLSANTTYHFRAVATNAGGPSLPGADQTFTTPPNAPTVVTEKASSITQTAAMLNAIVNPNGGPVSDCKLEYGSSASYGSSVPCTPSPGSGSSAVAVSASLGVLRANTTYHFRIAATNPGGSRSGGDESFTTAPVPPPPTTTTTTPTETTSATTTTKPETTTTTTSGTTTTTPLVTPKTATCRVSLASASVVTQAGGMAAIKLIWTGTAASTCSGKLTLTVKTKGKSKRSKPTLIATGNFSLPLGKTQIARVKLNEAGRALLNAGHGRLSANLAILELFPDPSPAQTETVHLAREARSSNVRKK